MGLLPSSLKFTCESCGRIERHKGTWVEANQDLLGRGWMFVNLDGAWWPFCPRCGPTLQYFIKKNLKRVID